MFHTATQSRHSETSTTETQTDKQTEIGQNTMDRIQSIRTRQCNRPRKTFAIDLCNNVLVIVFRSRFNSQLLTASVETGCMLSLVNGFSYSAHYIFCWTCRPIQSVNISGHSLSPATAAAAGSVVQLNYRIQANEGFARFQCETESN